ENALLYTFATFVVLWVVGWLYRDSLEVQNYGEKYVFVTGCDSGFGNLLCRKLDSRGFRVLAGCLTEKGADELRRMAGPRLKTVLLNVTNQESIQKAMEWTKKEVGDKGLWGIVNNAGCSLPMGPSEWMKVEDFHSTLNVNLNGVIAMTVTFLPLVKRARGRVVNVASVLDAVTSLEPIERELHRLWNQLNPEVQASYGDKYLDKYIKIQRLIMNGICDSDLAKVTNCMEHALTAAYPEPDTAPAGTPSSSGFHSPICPPVWWTLG
ncbi:hypothetical protein CRUP_003695, partial [Coryphaenoides rupestris]